MILIETELRNIDNAADRFLHLTAGYRHFAFYGEMGVGKTTFIRAICHALGVEGAVTSPTFALVNEYRGTHTTIYHFDFYRINRPEELFDIGSEEYFAAPAAYCFVEWPEKAEIVLPPDTCRVKIRELESGKREIAIHLSQPKPH